MSKPTAPIAAKPTRVIFDPFNSSATGHQRADNVLSGTLAWRTSRERKLHEQFMSGAGGGKRLSDTVGLGSEDAPVGPWDERDPGEMRAKTQRSRTQSSLFENGFKTTKRTEMPANPGKPTTISQDRRGKALSESVESKPHCSLERTPGRTQLQEHRPDQGVIVSSPGQPQIFANLCFYINGSTAPTISDHMLKHTLSNHGAKISIALARRTVTHVVIGETLGRGSGGGLAASKIQKEIQKVGGKNVKFVSAEWILQCVNAGRRVPESMSEVIRPQSTTVASMFRKTTSGKAQG